MLSDLLNGRSSFRHFIGCLALDIWAFWWSLKFQLLLLWDGETNTDPSHKMLQTLRKLTSLIIQRNHPQYGIWNSLLLLTLNHIIKIYLFMLIPVFNDWKLMKWLMKNVFNSDEKPKNKRNNTWVREILGYNFITVYANYQIKSKYILKWNSESWLKRYC
jgi:hypothetical protein